MINIMLGIFIGLFIGIITGFTLCALYIDDEGDDYIDE